MARTIFKDEHELFRKTVSAFIDREIAPHYERWEKEGQVSREVWRKAGEAGPAADRHPAGVRRRRRRLPLQRRHDRGDGQARVRRARLPPALRHRRALHLQLRHRGAEAHLAAEDGQGRGDHRHRHDRARHGQRPAGRCAPRRCRKGNELVVNGQKTFITNGGIADLVIVVAKTDTERRRQGRHAGAGRDRPPRLQARPQPQEDRPERAGHRRAVLRGRARAALQHPGRGGPRLRLPDEPAAARAPAGRHRRGRHHGGGAAAGRSSTRASARPSARPSPISRTRASSWPR